MMLRSLSDVTEDSFFTLNICQLQHVVHQNQNQDQDSDWTAVSRSSEMLPPTPAV